MFWRRRPGGSADEEVPGRPGQEASASDHEIEGQLEAELGPAPSSGPIVALPEPIVDGDLVAGMARSRGGFMARLRGILRLDAPDAATWEEVEETLIAGDVGAALAIEVVEKARARRHPEGPEAAVRGKTTTIGKIAARERAAGRSVLLAAGDTFRAAAIDQLRLWGERAAAPVVAHAPGADPSAVIYDALDAAIARGVDVLIADTAGRLHTKSNLMDELAKMRRVIDRRLPGARPEVLFVLDATTGQNGLAQARAFHAATGLTGIVLTKLDSTAKGGIVFAIEHALAVPVRFVGVGEKVGDLLPFDPDAFVAALFD
jgi:signal recognition particle GTPase